MAERDAAGEAAEDGGLGGRYEWRGPMAGPGGPLPCPAGAELRLDVDGPYALSTASGEVWWSVDDRVHWVASLVPDGPDAWTGDLWYRTGAAELLPSSVVRIERAAAGRAEVTVRFGAGGAALAGTFARVSPFLRDVEFEFDATPDARPVTEIATHDHPVRPASLVAGRLTVADVFRRAGFDVRASAGEGPVPLDGARPGASAAWSDAEMHDAMQAYWSRFADVPQWALWVLFAHLHEDGDDLGGIMFDAGGARDRQGTAIFTGSFICRPPEGEPHPEAWVRRMCFWTACHEMGHAFNLAHSWEKGWGAGWIPLSCDDEARSFMNYPHRVCGSVERFFGDFEFRFTDAELLFLRHAPERFVKMGSGAWGVDHGLRRLAGEPCGLELSVRANRDRPVFEFAEPVVLELKLRNVSAAAVPVPPDALSSPALTVVVQRDGQPPRRLRPPACRCRRSAKVPLKPRRAMYESLFAAVDRDGWVIAEPGRYTVRAALQLGDAVVASNAFQLRVLPPRSFDEEVFAQDLFSEDVGRVLSFDGSDFLHAGNETLQAGVDRFPDHPLAGHARIALASPRSRAYKRIVTPADAPAGATSFGRARGALTVRSPDVERVVRELHGSLMQAPDASARSLSHIDYHYYMDRFAAFCTAQGDTARAERVHRVLMNTLRRRRVPPALLRAIALRHARLLRPDENPRQVGDEAG
jgi:hypothetical protein